MTQETQYAPPVGREYAGRPTTRRNPSTIPPCVVNDTSISSSASHDSTYQPQSLTRCTGCERPVHHRTRTHDAARGAFASDGIPQGVFLRKAWLERVRRRRVARSEARTGRARVARVHAVHLAQALHAKVSQRDTGMRGPTHLDDLDSVGRAERDAPCLECACERAAEARLGARHACVALCCQRIARRAGLRFPAGRELGVWAPCDHAVAFEFAPVSVSCSVVIWK